MCGEGSGDVDENEGRSNVVLMIVMVTMDGYVGVGSLTVKSTEEEKKREGAICGFK